MRQYNEIVIGHSLAAVAYAFLNDALLIINKQSSSPFLFDFFESEFDLSSFIVEPTTYDMVSNGGIKTVGESKRNLWERLVFSLAVSGRLPFANKVQSIRINEDVKMLAVIIGGSSSECRYRSLRIFDCDTVQGLHSVDHLEEQKVRVFDWFNVRTGCCHEYDHLYSGDDLVKEIYFYPSPRAGTKNHNIKDLVAVSYLNRKQLNDAEYSDVAARFKILNMMKSVGIRGARNGRDQKNPQRYKYYAVKIEAVERQVEWHGRSEHSDAEAIFFDHRSEEEVILEHSFKENHSYKTLSQLIRR